MSGDAYKLEELRLKTAVAQEDANRELVKANALQLKVLEKRQVEKKEITDIYKYLLDIRFGAMFSGIERLYIIEDYDELHLELSKLYSLDFTDLGLHRLGNNTNYLFKDKRAYELGAKLGRSYFDKYNKFIALGHPGYNLDGDTRTYYQTYYSYADSRTLYHLSYSKYELENIFGESIEKAFKKLFELKEIIKKEEEVEKEKNEAEKKAEIEETKRKLAELEGKG